MSTPNYLNFSRRLVGLLCLCLALVGTCASAANRYVAVDGVDSGNCLSSASPCQTLGFALTVSGSGDRILMAAGEYTEMVQIDIDVQIRGESAQTTFLQAPLTASNVGQARVVTIDGAQAVAIERLTIRYGNASLGNGQLSGGGIHNSGANLSLKNVRVESNRAYDRGAGIYQSGASLSLINVQLSGNLNSAITGGEGLGGGLFSSGTTLVVVNSTVAYNVAEAGGGIYLQGGSLAVGNSIFWMNASAPNLGHHIHNGATTAAVISHTLVRNEDGDLVGNGGFSIDGNSFNLDPRFVDDSAGVRDLRLQHHSPAINAGRNQHYTNAGGSLASDTDLAGEPRLYTGGQDQTIDLGAFEHQGSPIDLAPPALVAPAHDAYPVAPNGRLIWQEVADADRYQVQLAPITSGPSNPFTNNLIDEEVQGLHIDLISLLPLRMFEWRVRPLMDDLVGDWSEVRRFTSASNLAVGPDQVIFVDPHRAASNGSGTSWANAALDLDDVLKWAHLHRDDGMWSSESPLQIWVAGASHRPRYRPDDMVGPFSSLNAAFVLVRDVQVFGGFTGTETSLSQRDFRANPANLSMGSAHRNLVIGAGELGAARLDGFIIHSANANAASVIEVNGESVNRSFGGGVHLVNSSPVLANLVIRNNQAEDLGGGMYVSGGQPRLLNVEVRDNQVGQFGGAGIYNNGGDLTLINGLIAGNSGGQTGGGLMNNGGKARLVNMTIVDNHAGEGGGLYNAMSEVFLHNSIIWNNEAVGWGNQVYDLMTGITVTEINHSLFRDEQGDIVEGDSLTILNSMSLDPVMVDMDGGDYRPLSDSPAIGAGSELLYVEAGGDPGADTDLDGLPRIGAGGLDLGGYQRPALVDQMFQDRFELD